MTRQQNTQRPSSYWKRTITLAVIVTAAPGVIAGPASVSTTSNYVHNGSSSSNNLDGGGSTTSQEMSSDHHEELRNPPINRLRTITTPGSSNDDMADIHINSNVRNQKLSYSSIQSSQQATNNNNNDNTANKQQLRHTKQQHQLFHHRHLFGFGTGSGGSDNEIIGGVEPSDNYEIDENKIQSEGFDDRDSTTSSNTNNSNYGGRSSTVGSSSGYGGSSSSSSGYGGSSSSSGYGGSSSSSTSGSDSGYGGSAPKSSPYSSSSSSYGSSPYSSSTSYGKSSYKSSYSSYKPHRDPLQIRLSTALTLLLTLLTVVTLLTAHQFVINPKGRYANSCKSSIEFLECIWKICYNLYHCRLGEIHDVVCAIDDEWEEEYSEQELAEMKLRPGIEKALGVEHQRALDKMSGKAVAKKIKKKITKKIAEKIGPIRKGPGMGSLV